MFERLFDEAREIVAAVDRGEAKYGPVTKWS
jgi:hypothetical protein